MAQSTSPARGTGDAWGTFLQQQQQPTGPENFNLLTPPPHDIRAGDSGSEAGSPTVTAAAAAATASTPLPDTLSYFEFHLAAQTAQIALPLESVNKLTKKIAELEEKGPTQAGPQAAASGPGGQEAQVQLPKGSRRQIRFRSRPGTPGKQFKFQGRSPRPAQPT